MKLGTVIIIVAATFFGVAARAAVPDPAIDMVGQWSNRAGCVEGSIGFVRDDGALFKLIYDNGNVYRSKLQVSMEGNMLHLIDDEKKFTYRIVGLNRIEFVGFTDLSNGLTARTRPKMWHRCSAS